MSNKSTPIGDRKKAQETVVVAKRLASDQEFRKAFFTSPREALRAAGIELSEKDLQEIETITWLDFSSFDSSFSDDEVLRCSAGY